MRRDDQILGLTHLVTLALRVLMLFEVLVRRGQEQSGDHKVDRDDERITPCGWKEQ